MCREIGTFYEQTGSNAPCIAILLFLDEKYDPGNCPVAFVTPHQFIRSNLLECLNTTGEQAGALTVLKPLALSKKEEVFEQIGQWKKDIYALALPQEKIDTLIRLLEYILVQRFPELTRKEVENMLQLTPLEKTVIGQELIQLGITQGIQQERVHAKKQAIGEVLQARFDIVPQHVLRAVQQIDDILVLDELLPHAAKVTNLQEFEIVIEKMLASE